MISYDDLAIRRYAQIIGVTVSVFILADVLWLPFSNIRIDPFNGIIILAACSIAAAYWGAAKLADRMAGRKSSLSRIWRAVSDALGNIAIFLVIFIPMSIASCLFMYLAAATSRPRMDWLLDGADGALGFDWAGALAYANSQPKVAAVLVFCYAALIYQLPIVVLWHSCVTGRRRLLEFCAVLFASSTLTAIVMALVPADGPYIFYNPASWMFDQFTSAGTSHAAVVDELRSGAPFDFLISRTVGLTCFPSFHTTLGIVTAFSLRKTPFFIPVVIVNAAMIVSTIPEGGHYLADVIAGAGVAIVSIMGVMAWASDTGFDVAQEDLSR